MNTDKQEGFSGRRDFSSIKPQEYKAGAAKNPVNLPWPGESVARVPYQVFLDATIYTLEQEKIFRGPAWNYVALEAELPNPGDFKATFIGDTPVVVTRDKEDVLHAFVNRCAHRGALVCRDLRGNRATHVCVYHQWSYDLKGDLIGVPFKKGIAGKGGYPSDFSPAQHSLHKLRVAAYNGLIFASFDEEVEPLPEYLGPTIRPWLDQIFNRPIRVLGHSRQFINANWKLYAENVRDPYHASLLHLFHTTFGTYRSSQGGGVRMDEKRRHSVLHAYRLSEAEELAAYKDTDLRTYRAKYTLADPSLLQGRQEFAGITILTLFPSLVVQQIQNTLAVRQIVPKAVNQFELIVTYFGYADDDAQMQQVRIKQANLIGPAGLISMEDGHAAEIVQQAITRDSDASSLIEMGGRGVDDQENLVTETGIRGFWQYYRNLMEFSARQEGNGHG
ncbi:MAG: aromatic ring-hydroxylating dioxygenase subunit alpha [Candidatus Binatia bacterium]